MTSWVLISLRVTNSLKVKVIRSPAKFTLFAGGVDFITSGGVSSFGPPDGDCWTAHADKRISAVACMINIDRWKKSLNLMFYFPFAKMVIFVSILVVSLNRKLKNQRSDCENISLRPNLSSIYSQAALSVFVYLYATYEENCFDSVVFDMYILFSLLADRNRLRGWALRIKKYAASCSWT